MSAAARRIRAELERAKEGNYLNNGWYSYISREDVEAVVDELLGRVDGPLTTGADGLKTLPGDQFPQFESHNNVYEIVACLGGYQLEYEGTRFSFHKTKEAAKDYALRLLGFKPL